MLRYIDLSPCPLSIGEGNSARNCSWIFSAFLNFSPLFWRGVGGEAKNKIQISIY